MRLLFSNQKRIRTLPSKEANYMPIDLFNMLIAFGKMTQANSYWREKRQNACTPAMTAKIVVDLEILICRS
jgi:hypothetical protein